MAKLKEEEKLFNRVKRFASAYEDTHVFTAAQWAIKEEENLFGEVVLVAEGELYHLLNVTNSRTAVRNKMRKKLNKILEKYDYYVEQGFHWSWHFCKKQGV